MSAVSSPFPMPSPEPAAPRRHAPESDTGRDAMPFSLPDDHAAETKSAAKERAEAKPAESVAKPAEPGPGAPALSGAKPAAASAPEPTPQPGSAEAAAPASGRPKQDVGTLVAIAEAEQAVAGEVGETVGKPQKSEGEDETKLDAAKADGGDIVAVLPTPMPDPAATTPAPAALGLPAAGEAQQPGSAGGEAPAAGAAEVTAPGAPGASGQRTAIQLAMAPVVPAPEMPQGPAVPTTDDEAAPMPDATSAPASDKAVHLAGAIKLPFDAAALGLPGASAPEAEALAAKVTGDAKPAETASTSHTKTVKDESADTASTAAATPAEIVKPAEAQQQPALTAIDLSALAHARAGKPDSHVTPGLDQAAAANAQQQLANGQQNAAGGQPTPLHVVPVEIGLRALAGSKRFDIRLDPAELGRIDVKLDISDKGEVSAKLVVDRVETLHLLQRDARTLERAFEQAGLKPSDAGVDITLRDQGDQSGFRQNQQQDEQASRRARILPEAETDDVATTVQPVPVRRLVRLGGVDLSI